MWVPGSNSAGAWAPDNRRLAVAAIRKGEPIITVFDTESGDRVREYQLEGLGEAFNPTWSPSGDRIAFVANEGFMEPSEPPPDDPAPADLTRQPLGFPADRDVRLQNLARGDEGFLLALGYSTQRGFGTNHPFVGEIRIGTVEVDFVPEELGFPVPLGEVVVTECQMVNQFKGSSTAAPQYRARLDRGSWAWKRAERVRNRALQVTRVVERPTRKKRPKKKNRFPTT